MLFAEELLGVPPIGENSTEDDLESMKRARKEKFKEIVTQQKAKLTARLMLSADIRFPTSGRDSDEEEEENKKNQLLIKH